MDPIVESAPAGRLCRSESRAAFYLPTPHWNTLSPVGVDALSVQGQPGIAETAIGPLTPAMIRRHKTVFQRQIPHSLADSDSGRLPAFSGQRRLYP